MNKQRKRAASRTVKRMARLSGATRTSQVSLFMSRDFSLLEDDENAITYISGLITEAAEAAVAEAKAMGVRRTYFNGSTLIEVNENGQESIIRGLLERKYFQKYQTPFKKQYVSKR